jgi:KDO2-lipid IV(A) lauroyltransferase
MPRQAGALRARLEYLPISAMVRTLSAMPLQRAVTVGASMGAMAMRLDLPNRKIALKNLSIAFPALDRAAQLKILAAMYRNLGRMMAEWTHLRELDRANIENYVTYDGIENLDHALSLSGKLGIIVLTAHYGNFELLPVAHTIYGYRLAMVHRPLRNPLVDLQVRYGRTSHGAAVIERKQAGRAVLKYLRDKRQVALALDLDVRDGVFVDFFGMKACTSDAIARIAVATKAPVVPAFMVRQGHSTRHRITILPAIDIVSAGSREENVRENTQRMTDVIEMMIRRHPEHWNWIHRRWKTRPPGEKRFY